MTNPEFEKFDSAMRQFSRYPRRNSRSARRNGNAKKPGKSGLNLDPLSPAFAFQFLTSSGAFPDREFSR